MSKIYSNIVPEEKVREKQRETLKIIADALSKSFGPMGSHTAIVKNLDPNGTNITIDYTKDGHTIVKSILFKDTIERSVQDILTELTRYVVREVGDGTTSAIILCSCIFDELCNSKFFLHTSPYKTIEQFDSIIKDVNNRIMKKARECTLEDIYNISLISTNNNDYISGILKQIYSKYGMDVYIDVGISNELQTIVKEYDGMVLDTGFTDMCFINDNQNNVARVSHPKIYAFDDPIDTPEMLTLLDMIIYNNILRCYTANSVYEPIPTVIFCKAISPDTSSYFESVVKLMNTVPNVPLLIVSDIHQEYLYQDIIKLCGAPLIKKYLNPDLQQKDIEAGLAPTPDTILSFCGSAELVESDQLKTKIFRPSKMYNEDGEYSDTYKSMIKYLESQIIKAKQDNAGIDTIDKLKRRLNSFKGCMVDLLIGGITLSDRTNLKASVEDAVLNCRSAAKNGVGFGSNYMAFSILNEIKNEDKYINNEVVEILYKSYYELMGCLYKKFHQDDSDVEKIILDSLAKDAPLNITTNEYDGKVLSSIKSDVIILNTISKILTLMFTCNQYLVQTPIHNIYSATDVGIKK